MPFHPTLTAQKWHAFEKPKQILNIASELTRARNGYAKGDMAALINSLDRTFELMELTVSDPKWSRGGRRELLRLREYLGEYYIADAAKMCSLNIALHTLVQLHPESSLVQT